MFVAICLKLFLRECLPYLLYLLGHLNSYEINLLYLLFLYYNNLAQLSLFFYFLFRLFIQSLRELSNLLKTV